MELCGLPKARPITCSDCPAFQRLHSSVPCAAESATRCPWVIHTTFEQKFYTRWCCTDPLRPPDLSSTDSPRAPQVFCSTLPRNYFSLAYSTLACCRMGMSGSASLRSARKSYWVPLRRETSSSRGRAGIVQEYGVGFEMLLENTQ